LPLYLVGGALRDHLLARPSRDWDLAGEAGWLEIFKQTAQREKHAWFYLDEESRQIRILLREGGTVDFLPFPAGQGIGEDLARRDFTVNSLALDLASGELLDPAGGREDLAARRLRMTSSRVFEDDPVRLLRGVRFAAWLGFAFEGGTRRSIKKQAALILKAAPERIRDELFKLLELPQAYAGLRLLEKSGLFAVLFPEFEATRGVGVNEEHLYDVYRHSFEVLKAADRTAGCGLKRFGAESRLLGENFQTELTPGRKRLALFKLAALLHDLGKPGTLRVHSDQSLTFYGHPHLGGGIAGEIAARLALSGEESAYLKQLVANHMRPLLLARQGTVSPRARYRLFRELGNRLPDLLLLALSDLRAGIGNKPEKVGEKAYLDLCRELLGEYYHPTRISAPPRLLNGHQIMQILKIKPGPQVGEILKELEEQIALGRVRNKAEAKRWVAGKGL